MRDKGICLIMSVWKMGILLEMITSMVQTLTYFWVWTTARTLTRFQFNRWGSASNWQVFFCRASVDPRYISIDRDSTSNRQVFRRHEFDPRYISTDRGSTSNRQVFFRRESLISRRLRSDHIIRGREPFQPKYGSKSRVCERREPYSRCTQNELRNNMKGIPRFYKIQRR